MRVLIAPDKFKGSLSAAQAAHALAEGWRQGWPPNQTLEIECLPIADGGEGTAEAIHDALAGRWVTLTVRDPLGDLSDCVLNVDRVDDLIAIQRPPVSRVVPGSRSPASGARTALVIALRSWP